MWRKHNKFSVSLIIWMLLFFVTGTLGYLDLEVTIFRNLLSSKHAALKKRIFPNVVKRRRPLNISYGTWYWRASGIKFPLKYWNVVLYMYVSISLFWHGMTKTNENSQKDQNTTTNSNSNGYASIYQVFCWLLPFFLSFSPFLSKEQV